MVPNSIAVNGTDSMANMELEDRNYNKDQVYTDNLRYISIFLLSAKLNPSLVNRSSSLVHFMR